MALGKMAVYHINNLKTSRCRCGESLFHGFNNVFSRAPARLDTKSAMAIGMRYLDSLLLVS